MDYLLTYDISTENETGQRRLAKVAKICEGFGVRVQYSVFECRLSNTAHAKLLQQLSDTIDPNVDSIRLYRINGNIADSCQQLGIARRYGANDAWII